MCGILGYVSLTPTEFHLYSQRLRHSLTGLSHRGPDAVGDIIYNVDSVQVGLGHTRLSVIDLSAESNQPLTSFDGRFTVTYNGEIYNYPELFRKLGLARENLRTRSDTEVLVETWRLFGESSLTQLEGMFAFALLDRQEGILTIARDAFGIKPLYIVINGDTLCFGSEIAPLLQLSNSKSSPNPQVTYDYLKWGFYDGKNETFFKGVSRVSSGSLLRICLKTLTPTSLKSTERKWFTLQHRPQVTSSFEEAADELRDLVLKSVKIHTRADVDLGVALSGGIDSSLIACSLRHLEPELPINTYSYVAKGRSYSEESWIDIVNKSIGAKSCKVEFDESDLLNNLDRIVRIQGEPFGDTTISAQNLIYSAARADGTKVILDGQGADEIFGGYEGFPQYRLRSLLDIGAYGSATTFLMEWGKNPARSKSKALLMLLGESGPPHLMGYIRSKLNLGGSLPNVIVNSYLEENMIHLGFPDYRISKSHTFRGRRLSEHLRIRLAGIDLEGLLRQADRNSMSNSVESRLPLLTKELAEFSLNLPEEFLVSSKGETKSLLRYAFRGILPQKILERKDKIGFTTPARSWMREGSPILRRTLQDIEGIPFLDFKAVQKLLARPANTSFSSEKLWRVINYVRWYKICMSS